MVDGSSPEVGLRDVVIVGGGCYGTFYAGQLMRAAEQRALADRRWNVKLRAEGSADDPKVTLTMEAFNLEVKRPANKAACQAATSPDIGKARAR